MENFFGYVILIVVCLILGGLIGILKKILEEKDSTNSEKELEEYEDEYEKTPILTDHEKRNYNIMLPIADSCGIKIFPKVRLADIITPQQGGKQSQKYFNKIKSKHCDFVLCNSRLEVVAVVEIDDPSHAQPKRKARYKFTDFILKDCGIETWHYTNVSAEQFKSKLMNKTVFSRAPMK